MSKSKANLSTTEIYDQALHFARHKNLPADAPRPRFTNDWIPENIAAIERYRTWLTSGGASEFTITGIYIPMAGHVFGLNLKPSAQLDLESDLQKGMDYVRAKRLSAEWTDISRVALEKLRRFLLFERGQSVSKITPYNPAPHTEGLPEWLVHELNRYQVIKQRNWRDARLEQNVRRFWSGHLRMWRFFVEKCAVSQLGDLKKAFVYDYAEERLKEGHAVRGVNGDLRSLHGFLIFLQDQGHTLPHALLRLPCLKEPDPLPKFLTDEQVRSLKADFDSRPALVKDAKEYRDAILDRAFFYLLWQGGLRLGELEELHLEDLDLEGRKLMVRKGKGLSDRTVFLTEATVKALRDYLALRGMGPDDHVFFYRNEPLKKDLAHARIREAGLRVGVHVYPHRFRHTFGRSLGRLVNALKNATRWQKRVFSPWRFGAPRSSGLVSFQGT